MKILATDGIAATGKAGLESLGFEVVTEFYEPEVLAEKVKEADCLIVRSATKVRQPIIDAALTTGRLKLVIRAGVGIDNIDKAYAEANGIAVRNTPKASSNAMSELALAHIFAVSRFIATANVEMRAGQWNKKLYTGTELSGSTLGLIGFGRTARFLAVKCAALGMKVTYYDIMGEDTTAPYQYLPFEELIRQADVISLHIPATADGHPVMGERELAMCKPGVRIVNCARGNLVEEKALLAALESGHVAAAGLDVFLNEPTPDPALINHPHVSATPHIGAQTHQAQERIAEELVEVVQEFFHCN